MNEAEKRHVYETAIDLLVKRAVAAGNPNNPSAYAAAVKTTLSNAHRSAARDLFAARDVTSGEELADLLEPPKPPVALAQPTPAIRTPPCRVCGCFGGGGWLHVERLPSGHLAAATPCPNCAVDRHRTAAILARKDDAA